MKKKTKTLMNKPVYLGLLILHLSKILMYEIFYDYLKPKYSEKVKLSHMDTYSFIFHVKNGWYLEKRFDPSNYDVDRPLPMKKKKRRKKQSA